MREQVFVLHVATRNDLLTYLENVTPGKLTQIPVGFHNSIWRNTAHRVATQQILCYKPSGVKPVVPEAFIGTYKKDTFPDGHIPTAGEIQELRALFISTRKQPQVDYERDIFANFTLYITSYGCALTCIEDAIYLNNTHEGMYLGVVTVSNYFAK